MNKNLKAHIDALRIALSRGPVSDDFEYPAAYLGHQLKTIRNLLIVQKADKYKKISPFSYQTLCVELIPSALTDCLPIELSTACKWLRSKEKLPAVLNASRKALMAVHFHDGRMLSQRSLASSNYSDFKESKSKSTTYFIQDGYLFVESTNKYLSKILITGVFEDPEEVALLRDGCYVVGEAVDFTIDPELVSVMYELTVKSILATYTIPRDDENNAKATEVSQVDALN